MNDNDLNAKTVLDYQTPKYTQGNKLRMLKDITTRNSRMSKSPSNSSKSWGSNFMNAADHYIIKLNEISTDDQNEYYSNSRFVL